MNAPQAIKSDSWTVAGRTFTSRLIVGTGKYKSLEENAAAVAASGAEIVTVAVRRVNISDPSQPMLTDFIDPKKITYLPNTAGCFTADDAIRTLRLAREAGGWNLVKLEVLGEAKTLYPDMRETLKATEVLVKEGFEPMVYCVDDPIAAKQLEEAGAVAIMPLGAPIGSGLGIQNRVTIRLIVEGAGVPVLVDAGVGTASDAARGDGAGLRRRADEHRDRRGQGPGADGAGDEGGGRGGPAGLSRGPDAEAPLRRPVEPAGGTDLGDRHAAEPCDCCRSADRQAAATRRRKPRSACKDLGHATVIAAEPIALTASDGVKVYGSLYRAAKPRALILLFHQAGSSKDEYATIAPRLAQAGYSALAIDQRSGGGCTARIETADALGEQADYLDTAARPAGGARLGAAADSCRSSCGAAAIPRR